MTYSGAPTPVFGRRSDTVDASLRDFDGRQVAWFSLEGGKHRGAIGTAEGDAIARTVKLAVELGLPVVGRIASSGADVTEGAERPARLGADRQGASPTRRAWCRSCWCSWARRCRARRCCSASPTT